MSVATQIERLQNVRNQIRAKMVSLGLSSNTDLLQKLANDLDGIASNGDASTTLSTSTRSKTLSAGYYTGGTIKVPDDYFPVNSTNTTATSGDVLSDKKFVNTSGTTVTGTIKTASSSDITGTVTVTNPAKITLNTSSTTGSNKGSANASATIAKTLYSGASGVTNSSLGAQEIKAEAEVTLATSVVSSTSIPATLPSGTVEVSPSTTRTLYSDTSTTKGYLKSFVVSAISTQTKEVAPTTSAQTITPDSGKFLTSVKVGAISTQTKEATPSTSAQTITPDSGKYLTSVKVGAIPNQKTDSDVSVSATAGISNVTSINASQATDGVEITATADGSTTVPLGYYSSKVSKSATQSTKSTTIKPTLANTNGSIELTAGTSSFTKTSTSDYSKGFITSVTVNPTPSQTKSASPSTSAQTISPDSGKLLSSVSISAISTETKTITAGTSDSTTSASSGKYITSVTVKPTPSQSKSATPTMASQTVSPDSGKLLSSVTVNAVPSFSVTLSSSSWSSDSNTTIGKYYYNVSNDKVTASNNLYVMPSSASTAQSFGVYAYSQSAGSMQFRAVAQPTSNLEYTVYYLS